MCVRFYTPHWEADLLPCVPSEDTSDGALLLFADPSAFGEKVAAELLMKRSESVVVRKGNDFTKHDEKSYTIRSHEPSDYERLISNLVDDKINVSKVCHLRGLSERLPSQTEEEWVKQTQQDSYYSLLYIGQALKKYVDQKVSITVLSSLTYAVGGEPVLYPEKAVHLGPAMVISQETPNLRSWINGSLSPTSPCIKGKVMVVHTSCDKYACWWSYSNMKTERIDIKGISYFWVQMEM
ncbi:KR prefix domain-containing protein [Bacillus subtilis]|uniref:KR prefix domain-containing protein n=1 Tax=Bacillus subtilis TaxID=1423 RepID=UPI003EBF7C21